MEIIWLGHAHFRLRSRDATVVTDPFPWKSSGPSGRVVADVVTVSHQHPGHNAVATVMGSPKVLTGPGEYEVKGISIIGIPTYHDGERGKKRGKNTVYLIEMEDLVVCHLGDLGHVLTTDQVDEMRNNVDVLLIPVGGEVTIDAAQAVEVISLIEPRLVIPMHYRVGDLDAELDPLERFLREMGTGELTTQSKLTVTKSSIPEVTQVVALEPRSS